MFEFLSLIILWFIVIVFIAPTTLYILIRIIEGITSVIEYKDSDSLLDKVKAPNPVEKIKPCKLNAVEQDTSFFSVKCGNNYIDKVLHRQKIMAYIKRRYSKKYPTMTDFVVMQEMDKDTLIIKNSVGSVIGREELDMRVLCSLEWEKNDEIK